MAVFNASDKIGLCYKAVYWVRGQCSGRARGARWTAGAEPPARAGGVHPFLSFIPNIRICADIHTVLCHACTAVTSAYTTASAAYTTAATIYSLFIFVAALVSGEGGEGTGRGDEEEDTIMGVWWDEVEVEVDGLVDVAVCFWSYSLGDNHGAATRGLPAGRRARVVSAEGARVADVLGRMFLHITVGGAIAMAGHVISPLSFHFFGILEMDPTSQHCTSQRGSGHLVLDFLVLFCGVWDASMLGGMGEVLDLHIPLSSPATATVSAEDNTDEDMDTRGGDRAALHSPIVQTGVLPPLLRRGGEGGLELGILCIFFSWCSGGDVERRPFFSFYLVNTMMPHALYVYALGRGHVIARFVVPASALANGKAPPATGYAYGRDAGGPEETGTPCTFEVAGRVTRSGLGLEEWGVLCALRVKMALGGNPGRNVWPSKGAVPRVGLSGLSGGLRGMEEEERDME
ncbi:hypothetical protein DFH07DRAFT_767039 [Mycena maculata]|uniref:Uncharacterized protein n=1 Tax=Mycena maculata TaxID=230809 RepID=A0AAD7K2C7_9AGAR|nr:hypothetical protein DFH07DRAFT_767039 [Mycena maculata]